MRSIFVGGGFDPSSLCELIKRLAADVCSCELAAVRCVENNTICLSAILHLRLLPKTNTGLAMVSINNQRWRERGRERDRERERGRKRERWKEGWKEGKRNSIQIQSNKRKKREKKKDLADRKSNKFRERNLTMLHHQKTFPRLF